MKKILLFSLTLLFALSAWAQNRVVSGKVTDLQDGSALPGVNVVLKGTANGSVTDSDGNYSVSIPSSGGTLVFSFIGFKTQEVDAGEKTIINAQMTTEARGLDEVVVTALGIERSKKSLAYSISDVKSEDLVKGGAINAMKSLDGKISGVNLTSLSSDPTSSVLVNIRGNSLLPTLGGAANSQPLYVINGVPMYNSTASGNSIAAQNGVDFGNILSQLNPEDIESITVLKGGSAGALYGSAGGNGVIMITTKSGKGGKKGIGVSASVATTADSPYRFIKEQNQYGQGERADSWQYDNTDTYGPKLDGSFTGDFWNTKTQQWENGPQRSANEDRVKAYLQTGTTVTTNVNLDGNYDKGSFRLSVTDMKNTGVMPNTKTTQNSISFNSDYRLTDKIKITANANYVRTYSPNKANVTGSNSILNRLLFNLPTNLQPLSDMKNYWLTGFDGLLMNGAIQRDNGIDQSEPNPWWITNEQLNIFTRNNFFGKIQMDWKLNDNFSLLLRSGLNNLNENYEYRQSFGIQRLSNRPGSGDGAFNANTSNAFNVVSDAIISYNKTVSDFTFAAAAGVNYVYNSANSYYTNASALSTPNWFNTANAFPNKLTAGYDWSARPQHSFYGTFDVSWKEQLFLGLTGRQDYIGNLSEEKINYFYPSVSASWLVNESFVLPQQFDMVKVRLAYANVGNGLINYRNIDTFGYTVPDWSGSVKTGTVSSTLIDPSIKPMSSVTKEVGLDMWLFRKKIMLDLTYFSKSQINQTGSVPVVPGSGYTSMTTNIGDVTNKGIEIGLTINPVKSNDWNWSVTGSFTHYKATMTSLSDQFLGSGGYYFANYDGKTMVKVAPGEVIGNIYEQNPILRVTSGKYAGMPLLDDDGKFQNSGAADRQQIGNYNPNYILGLNTTLTYKRFSLNMVGSFRVGGKYVSVNQQYMDSNGRSIESLSSGDNNPYWKGGRDASMGGLPWPAVGSSDYQEMNDYNDPNHNDNLNDAGYAKGVWLVPGSDASNDANYVVNGADPKNTFYDFTYNAFGDVIWNFAGLRSYDATNFKMREISLNYNLPTALATKMKLTNVNLSFIARNVFQWNKSGRNEDPETAFTNVAGTGGGAGAQGVLRATLPSIRSLGFKLSLSF